MESRASPPGGRARRPSLHFSRLHRPRRANHPLFYRRPLMATSTRNTSGGPAPAIVQNYERERVFGLFRQFGYLEAELQVGMRLRRQQAERVQFDTTIDNEWARQARRI